MRSTKIWLPFSSAHLLKREEEKWVVLVIQTFLCESRDKGRDPDFEWGEWQRKKKTEKGRHGKIQWSPSKTTLEAAVETKTGSEGHGNERSRNFQKDDTFLSFAERTTAYQSNVQYSARAWVTFFSSFVLPAIVLKIIRHINHVDISLFPPRVHRCHMLSRARPFVFQGALGK